MMRINTSSVVHTRASSSTRTPASRTLAAPRLRLVRARADDKQGDNMIVSKDVGSVIDAAKSLINSDRVPDEDSDNQVHPSASTNSARFINAQQKNSMGSAGGVEMSSAFSKSSPTNKAPGAHAGLSETVTPMPTPMANPSATPMSGMNTPMTGMQSDSIFQNPRIDMSVPEWQAASLPTQMLNSDDE